jgi:hypothetical protein
VLLLKWHINFKTNRKIWNFNNKYIWYPCIYHNKSNSNVLFLNPHQRCQRLLEGMLTLLKHVCACKIGKLVPWLVMGMKELEVGGLMFNSSWKHWHCNVEMIWSYHVDGRGCVSIFLIKNDNIKHIFFDIIKWYLYCMSFIFYNSL